MFDLADDRGGAIPSGMDFVRSGVLGSGGTGGVGSARGTLTTDDGKVSEAVLELSSLSIKPPNIFRIEVAGVLASMNPLSDFDDCCFDDVTTDGGGGGASNTEFRRRLLFSTNTLVGVTSTSDVVSCGP